MKKILVLTHEYYPFKGGVARYCYNMFKFFDVDDYMVATDHTEVLSKDNVLHVNLTSKFIKPSWLFSFWKIRKIIKDNNIKQVFTPNILPLGSMAHWLGVPYVISLHGLDINLALKNKPRLTTKILKRAAKIIVNTKNTAKLISHLDIPKNKIHLIYPSLDFKIKYDPNKLLKIKQSLKIKSNDRVLLTVGRLNSRKGQDMVIRALNQLKKDFNLKYIIVGSGDFKKELLLLIRKYQLQNRVFIYSGVEDEDLIYYYKLANIFVMPNRSSETDIEGFGIVFLEAARLSIPIIGGDSGGVTELFTHEKDALLVKTDNLDQLIEYIRRLLNNPQEADKLAKRAFARSQDFADAQEQSLILSKIL
jgi:phosphatidyl-myo-inositol dimannoside synthase